MLTLFIHFLLNMETLAWLMPLRVYRHSCMRTPCAHVCEGSTVHTRWVHPGSGEHWLHFNPWQVSRTSKTL